MLYYTVGQLESFLLLLYAGIALGALLHFFDFLRAAFEAGRLLSIAMDLLYCAMALAVLALSLLRAGDGEVRPYLLLGALTGLLLYLGTVRPALRRALAPASRAVGAWARRAAASAPMRKIFK